MFKYLIVYSIIKMSYDFDDKFRIINFKLWFQFVPFAEIVYLYKKIKEQCINI